MKELFVSRDLFSHTETESKLTFGDEELFTIERPWIPYAPGGKSRASCVPAGRYILRPHRRPNGDEVVALVNPGHAVYYLPEDRPSGVGRYLILIHIGNWVENVVGCLAPGLTRTDSQKGPMVTSSRAAMEKVMDYIDGDEAVIQISWKNGEPDG